MYLVYFNKSFTTKKYHLIFLIKYYRIIINGDK